MDKNTKINKRGSISSNTSSYASISFSTSNNKSMTKKRKQIRESSQDVSSDTNEGSRKTVSRKKNKKNNASGSAVKNDQKRNESLNPYKGVSIDYNEPPEAQEPKKRWRLCPVKYNESVETYGKSVYLIGRLRKIVDIPISHPTCSKQHAALQYRLVKVKKNDGTFAKTVRPYLIDLDSVNGTFINNKKIDSRKYIELREKDVIKFGNSSVQYVLLHGNNKNSAGNDDDGLCEVENVSVKKELGC